MSAEKKKVTDPQVTIDVKNEKLEELVDTYAKKKTGEAYRSPSRIRIQAFGGTSHPVYFNTD